ncbi:MAG: DUF3394 domain-containing protein, partial [Deltaproteobacteria bacterium]
LWGIDSWGLALLIFVMTCLGAFAFAGATQGWFAWRNRWWDVPLLLLVTAMMFRPDFFGDLLGIENHYVAYIPGLIVLGLVIFWQKWRQRRAQQVETGGAQ